VISMIFKKINIETTVEEEELLKMKSNTPASIQIIFLLSKSSLTPQETPTLIQKLDSLRLKQIQLLKSQMLLVRHPPPLPRFLLEEQVLPPSHLEQQSLPLLENEKKNRI
jgi:hypothetical protein